MTLQRHDLKNLVDSVIEIDSFKSKMGADEDIITVAISTISKESAQDLTDFFERGYTFVLDADTTVVNKQTEHIKYLLKLKEIKILVKT